MVQMIKAIALPNSLPFDTRGKHGAARDLMIPIYRTVEAWKPCCRECAITVEKHNLSTSMDMAENLGQEQYEFKNV